MLSYQHIYHAGNLADVHKHTALAWMLEYLTRKEKPVSYIETHAGRALYDLAAEAALKTGEAAQGIETVLSRSWYDVDHPYQRTVDACRTQFGANTYPGSPWIAQHLLRPGDSLHLAELHPQESQALQMAIGGANIYCQDGFEMAQSITPPTPRRGIMLVDPSYEIKSDYATLPNFFNKIAKKWNVGILMLWYPVLVQGSHKPMVDALLRAFPDALDHRVNFPPAKQGHRMIGSGLFIVNPPFGLDQELAKISANFGKFG